MNVPLSTPTMTTEHFSGKAGLLDLRQRIIAESPKQLMLIVDYDHYPRVFSEAERLTYTQQRKAAGIFTRVIFASQEPKNHGGPLPDDYIWVAPTQLDITCDIYIFNDTVAFATLGNPDDVTAVLISSKDLATSMKNWFSSTWDSLK